MSSFKTFQRKAGHILETAVQKGSGLMETGKIKLSIGKEERAIDELFYRIGEAVYENCRKNGVTPEYIANQCDEIDQRRSRVTELKSKLNAASAECGDDIKEEEIIIDINLEDDQEKKES